MKASDSLQERRSPGEGLMRVEPPADEVTKVLHVVEAYGGGVQSALSQYVSNSPFAHHEVVYRRREGHDTGISLGEHEHPYSGSLAGFIRYASRKVRLINPDFVHLHSSYAGIVRVLAARCGAGLIYTPHCYAFERTNHPTVINWLVKRVERGLQALGPAHIAAVSPHEAKQSTQILRANSVSILPNVARTDSRTWAAFENRLSKPAPRVVGIGRVSAQKDPAFFSQVARALRSARLEFIWVGDGSSEARRDLEAAGVQVTGWVSNTQAREILASAGLYLHTASWEGSPIAPLEATELGVPVVAREVPSLSKLGYFPAGDSVGKVASTIRSYFHSRDFRLELLEQEKARADQLSESAQRRALEALYSSANRRL